MGIAVVTLENIVWVTVCLGNGRIVKVGNCGATWKNITIINAVRERVSVYGVNVVTHDFKTASDVVSGPKNVSISGIIVCPAHWGAGKCRNSSWSRRTRGWCLRNGRA